MLRLCLLMSCRAGVSAANLAAQDRATKVRHDKQRLADDATWIYNDLDRATAKRAGFHEGDVLVRFGDRVARLSESQFIAAALEHPRGARVPVEVLRGDERLTLDLPLQ